MESKALKTFARKHHSFWIRTEAYMAFEKNRGGTNTQPGHIRSGNSFAKSDPRYLTLFSAKVLISRITVNSVMGKVFMVQEY